MSKLTKFLLHVACCLGSVLLMAALPYVTYFRFVDDVIVAYDRLGRLAEATLTARLLKVTH